MTSANAKKQAALKEQQAKELAAVREGALEGATAPSDEVLLERKAAVPPLSRPADHQFEPQPESEHPPEVIQPDLTETSMAEVEADFVREQGTVDVTHLRKEGVDNVTVSTRINETELERMTDEQIARSGLLSGDVHLIHPARVAPSSERVRTPMQKEPAAGPGSWPVPEDSLPAAMPSDPPVEDREDAGDNTFAKVAGVTVRSSGDGIDVHSTRAGTAAITVPKKQVAQAANLYMVLRAQHPQLTAEQLQDEFYLQLEGIIGVISPHGQTAAGDDRTDDSTPGAELQAAIAELVNKNSEAKLRERWSAIVEKSPLLAGMVKADTDKGEIARLILANERADEEE